MKELILKEGAFYNDPKTPVYIPVCANSKILVSLLNKKSFSKKDLKTLEKLDVNLVIMRPEFR